MPGVGGPGDGRVVRAEGGLYGGRETVCGGGEVLVCGLGWGPIYCGGGGKQ